MEKNALVKQDDNAQMLENVLLGGDLSKLTPGQRVSYYQKVCESVGLNPLTKPFGYITLNGKMVLYALKDAAEQLRSSRHVSITQLEKQFQDDLYIVTAHAQTPDGRTDASTGAVSIGALKGDAKANALMKAETKAKRRVTLSICGMGFLDESEISSIPDARPVIVTETGEINQAQEETGGNPDPIDDKAWDAWLALANRAEKVNVDYPLVDREAHTKAELRDLYAEIRGYVESAEAQAKADSQPPAE